MLRDFRALKNKTGVMQLSRQFELQVESRESLGLALLKNARRVLKIGCISGILCFNSSVWAVELTPDLQLNGYATVGLSKLGNNQGDTYPNPSGTGAPVIQSRVSGKYDSVAGLQLNYHVNDQISLTTQMYVAAHGTEQNSYAPKVNWAYIDYNFNDEWTLRAGRFSFATYLYSENLHVGEAYPWARLPPDIYAELGGLYSENGVGLLYRHAIGDWMLRIQPSLGAEDLNGYQLKNIKQLVVSLSNDNLTLHMGSGLADVNIDPANMTTLVAGIDGALAAFGYSPTEIDQYNASLHASIKLNKVRGAFSDVGFLYDDGHWFAAGEMGGLRVSGLVSDFNAGYVSVGHHFGKWLPYLLYARYKDVNLDQLNEIPAPGNAIYGTIANIDQYTMSMGARYRLRDNVSLKFQADRVAGFKSHYLSGFFVPPPGSNTPSTLSSAYIYSVSLNAVF